MSYPFSPAPAAYTPAPDAIAAAQLAQTTLTLAKAAWLEGEKRGPWGKADARRAIYDAMIAQQEAALRAAGFTVNRTWQWVSIHHPSGPKVTSEAGLTSALKRWLQAAKP